ncbi:hypothetical protein [Deinococcus ruber]|uniref:Uncharacterized protein n=1 Tax=Deinococcus ruber TaxID=1848197 RepID=A0A918C9Q0_9DEIO|nr:hypothetical protein [Deinococcus ruber]GGR12831.1 hypothetical protein GCM10008957_27220 [Deinococcus ruber]
MKPLFNSLLLIAALAGGPAVLAAPTQDVASSPYIGGNITRTYSADDLKKTYGILDMAVGEIWVINLPDTVTDVITSRDGVLQFSQRGNRVVMGAIASTGSFPVLVMTADSVYFFQARLSPNRGGGMRNVIVRGDEAPSQDQQIPGFPSSPAATPVSAAPAAPKPQPVAAALPLPMPAARPAAAAAVSLPTPTTVGVPARVLPAPTTAPSVVNPSAPATPAAPVAARQASPTAAGAVVDFRAMNNGQQTELYYRVINNSGAALSFDETSLTLRNAVGPVVSTPTRRNVTVAAGETVFGQITIPSAQTAFSAMWVGYSVEGQPLAQVLRDVTVEHFN